MIQQPGNTDLIAEPVSGKFRSSFRRIIGAIRAYHTELGYPKVECTKPERIAQHRQLCLAIHAETTELLDAVPWKPWRPDDYKPVDWVNVAEELADIIFFCTSISETWNIPEDILADILERKLVENRRRILNGYSKPSDEM